MDAAGDKLMDDYREVVAAAEELLKAASGQDAERLQELRGRAEEALRKARARMEDAGFQLEAQVRNHPLAAVGIAAAVGLVVGLLLARK
ncbi:MAG TPA: DUF883 family protein [Burkholderiales bacterium]|nr:DUF883 family protein [Burkholderiales bacterium]